MSNPKKHHYVPQSYQLLFSLNDNGDLFYYDKKSLEFIGPVSPRGFCVQKHLYSLTGNAAKLTDVPTLIENPMLSTIDGEFVDEVKKLISGNSDKANVRLYNMARFFGFLAERKPEFIQDFEERSNKELFLRVLEYAKSKPDAVAKAENMGIDLNNKDAFKLVKMSESRNMSLVKMIEKAEEIAELIHDSLGWMFLYAYEKDFILSDTPFVVLSEAIELKGVLEKQDKFFILIPLSRQLCVVFSSIKKNIDHRYLSHHQTGILNDLVFQNAERWVMGSSENILKDTVEYKKAL